MATEYSPEHPDGDVMAELLLALAEQDDAYEKRSTVEPMRDHDQDVEPQNNTNSFATANIDHDSYRGFRPINRIVHDCAPHPGNQEAAHTPSQHVGKTDANVVMKNTSDQAMKGPDTIQDLGESADIPDEDQGQTLGDQSEGNEHEVDIVHDDVVAPNQFHDHDNVAIVQIQENDVPPTSSVTTSSYTLRNRGTQKSKLVYDLKYHPMDDNIRPTQAARRRQAHGEQVIYVKDDSESEDEAATNPDLGDDDEGEIEVRPKSSSQSQKRVRSPRASAEPTRRSSRKHSEVRLSYNMNIHPQDEALLMLSDSSSDVPAPSRKKRKTKYVELGNTADKLRNQASNNSTRGGAIHGPIDLTTSDHMDPVSETLSSETGGSSGDSPVMDSSISSHKTVTTPVSSLRLTPPPYGIRQMDGLDVLKMKPGERYFRRDQDSWPVFLGQPFVIHADSLEDHLANEATAASPLNYEHDDKENDTNHQAFETPDNPASPMSIMPALTYRRTSDDERVDRYETALDSILFNNAEANSSYSGHGEHHGPTKCRGNNEANISPDALRILASSENL